VSINKQSTCYSTPGQVMIAKEISATELGTTTTLLSKAGKLMKKKFC
jgi:hypothetical protein